MNGFEYKYNTPNDILQNILLLQEKSPIELGVFLGIFIWFVLMILYIIPMINIFFAEFTKRMAMKKKKDFIRQIAIRKDIEDQILQEIDSH